jgi:hypothetical protein
MYLLPMLAGGWLNRAWLWAALVGPFTYLMYMSVPNREHFDIVAIEWGGFLLLALLDPILARRNDRPPAGQADGRDDSVE